MKNIFHSFKEVSDAEALSSSRVLLNKWWDAYFQLPANINFYCIYISL